MPNWCSTGITFYSRNKEQIQEMLRDFKAIYNGEPTYPNDFGHGWMGDFANKYFVNLGHNEINCRGCVGFIDDEITSRSGYWGFQMSTETAWAPKMGMWQRITEMFYPDVLISYISEECGTGCFTKCDDTGLFYPEDFYIDGCFPSLDGSFDVEYVETHEFLSIKSIFDYLDEILPFKYEKTESLGKLSEEINQKLKEIDVDDQGYYIQIEEYDVVHPDEFNFLGR